MSCALQCSRKHVSKVLFRSWLRFILFYVEHFVIILSQFFYVSCQTDEAEPELKEERHASLTKNVLKVLTKFDMHIPRSKLEICHYFDIESLWELYRTGYPGALGRGGAGGVGGPGGVGEGGGAGCVSIGCRPYSA